MAKIYKYSKQKEKEMKPKRSNIGIYVILTILFIIALCVMLLVMMPRPVGAAIRQDACRDNPIIYYCYPGLGCDPDPIFIRSVGEMVSELGLPDDNYLPCRVIVDVVDDGRFEIPYPHTYLCWDYKPICAYANTFYAAAWTSGEQDTHIESVEVWLERHIPNYIPLAFWRNILTDLGRDRQSAPPGAAGYPPPLDGTPEPPPYP